MSIEQITHKDFYQGLSSDTKPVTSIDIGSEIFEVDTGVTYWFDGSEWVKKSSAAIDSTTNARTTVSYPHHETHGGSRFYRHYSVASLGAMAAPDDMVTLTWKTPNTTKWEHFTFYVIGTGGWLVEFIEGSTGGGGSHTGVTPMLNHNRNYKTILSTCLDLASGAGNVSYDATKLTGGLSLFSEYIPGGSKSAGSVGADRDEIVLEQNQTYQLSCYGTDADTCSLHVDWYEHTDK